MGIKENKMGTIREVKEYFENNKDRILIYNSLGKELTDELNNHGAKLVITHQRTFYFENISEELQAKVDSKNTENKARNQNK